VSAAADEIERLRAEVDRLARTPPVAFLGERIAWDILGELESGKLSASEVKTRGVGMHGDGGSLWLQVASGGRSWLFRYRFGGRQREMGLGSVREVPLAEARARAVICRRLVTAKPKIDPIERKRVLEARAPTARSPTRSTRRGAVAPGEASRINALRGSGAGRPSDAATDGQGPTP
jgi:hypothetical protein